MRNALGLAFIFLCCLSGEKSSQDLVLDAFKKGDFVPHVFTDQQVTRQHGEGAVRHVDGGIERVYASTGCKVWLRLSVGTDADPEYRIVEELLLSSIPLSKKEFFYNESLCKTSLHGISLGDKSSKISKVFRGGGLIKKGQATLAGRSFEEIYVNPNKDESDLYYRFYIEGSEVAAFSIGVTE